MTGVAAANPRQQFFDSAGNPLVGGFVDVYLAGTTTRTDTWRERTLIDGNKNTNPIELDARGECALWLDEDVTYKLVLKNSSGSVQYTADNVVGAAGVHILADVTAAKDAALTAIGAAEDTAVAAVGAAEDVSVAAVATAQATAEAAVTVLVTQAQTAETNAEAAEAQAENYAAAAATGSKFYDTIALGNAGVTDTQTFGVVAGGSDGLARPSIYRRESAGVSTFLYGVVPGSEADELAHLPDELPNGYELSGQRWVVFGGNDDAIAAQLKEDEEKFRFHLPVVAASVETPEMIPEITTPSGYELAGWNFAIAGGTSILMGEDDSGELYLPGDSWVLYTGVVSSKTQVFSLNKLTGVITQISPAGSNNTAPFRDGRYAAYTSDRVGGDAANGLYAVPLAGGTEIPYFCRERLACWGDSQTLGTGATPGVTDYPTVLGGLLGGWTVYNGGVAGETSAQITVRELADSAHLSDLAIYKMGRNDNSGDLIQSVWSIRQSIEHHKTGAARHRFIVLSQYPGLAADVARCTYVNAVYADMWPGNYCDVYAALLAAGDGSPTDIADVAAGIVPTSLRADTTPHLNAAGYAIEAQAIHTFITSKGWA
jgi:hypothetical protein